MLALLISISNGLFANDSTEFVNSLVKQLLLKDSSKLGEFVFTPDEYLRYLGSLGEEFDEDEELGYLKSSSLAIRESIREVFHKLNSKAGMVGRFELYDFKLTPRFDVNKDINGDTSFVHKLYRLELILAKGVVFFSLETQVLRALDAFYLIHEFNWKGWTHISEPKKVASQKKDFYMIFSYFYGQILFDSRYHQVYVGNNGEPAYYQSKLKLDKKEENAIIQKLKEINLYGSPRRISCENISISSSRSCDTYRIYSDGFEHLTSYCCTEDETLKKKFDELGQLIRKSIAGKRSFQKIRKKAQLSIGI